MNQSKLDKLIDAYRDVHGDATDIKIICKLLHTDIQCNFVTFGWNLGNGFWHIPVVYDTASAIVANTNQDNGWYINKELSMTTIPVSHSHIIDKYTINSKNAVLIYGYTHGVNNAQTNNAQTNDAQTNDAQTNDKLPLNYLSAMYFFTLEALLEKVACINILNMQKNRQELILSRISQSVRIPLNEIIHTTKKITESNGKNTVVQVDELSQSVVTMATNIFDIIDMSKLELGKLQINESLFNIKALFNEVLALANNLNKTQKVQIYFHIDSSVPEIIYSDARRIKQILINLIENSLKYTITGEIFLHVSSCIVNLASEDKENGSNTDLNSISEPQVMIVFSVKDTGTGIEEHIKQDLFKPYELLNKNTHRGLSLRISYMLALALGGKLSVSYSKINAGTCMEFSLVLASTSVI